MNRHQKRAFTWSKKQRVKKIWSLKQPSYQRSEITGNASF